MRPAKTQSSLPRLIRVSAVHSMGIWWPTLSAGGQRRFWSDWADAQADLSLRWAHIPFCRFCHVAAHFYFPVGHIFFQCDIFSIEWWGKNKETMLHKIAANCTVNENENSHSYKVCCQIYHVFMTFVKESNLNDSTDFYSCLCSHN